MTEKISRMRLTLLLIATLFSQNAFAFVYTMSTNGQPVRWPGERKYNLAGNPTGSTQVSSNDFFNMVVRALQRWNIASDGGVRFDYWQGTNTGTYEPNSEYNGLSSIYFASQDNKGTAALDASVIALTQVWYNTDNAEIKEADIVLNDIHYNFTTDKTDTTGTGGIYSAGGTEVFLENVITHEVGHAYGLSHSGNLQSSMLFMEAPDQTHLSCDDQVGIRNAYSVGLGGTGTLVGRVQTQSGDAVRGAHVQLISRRRGTVLASVMTDQNGNYEVRGLEPGEYAVMAEPYNPGQSALSGGYFEIDQYICGGSKFARSFLKSGNDLVQLSVQSGQTKAAPALSVQCTAGAAVSTTGSSQGTPYEVDVEAGGFGLTDRISVGQSSYYRVDNVSGTLEVRGLSYSLYSNVQVELELLTLGGSPVSSQSVQPVYSSESGFNNRDAFLRATGLPSGDYLVRASASYVGMGHYPAGAVSLDMVPFIAVVGEMNPSTPVLQGEYAYNAKCRQDESFPAYQSPGGDPPRSSTGGFGFCGNIRLKMDENFRGPPSPPTAGALATFAFPFLLMFLAYVGMRRWDLGYLARITESGKL